MFIVYKATSPSNKVYIGITTRNLRTRINEHFSKSKKLKTPFSSALKKYGKKIKWEILDTAISFKELTEKEKYYVHKCKSFFPKGYNYTLGGEGSLGKKHSQKTKKLLSKLGKGRVFSKETRKKISERNKNRKHKKSSRVKICKSLGHKNFYVYEKQTLNLVGVWLVKNYCAKDLGLSRTKISDCLNGRRKSTGGYIFSYKEVQNRQAK